MAKKTVETVWKLIFDKSTAQEGESFIQRLGRVIKEKIGIEGTEAIDKTTEALERQKKAADEAAKANDKIKPGGKGGKDAPGLVESAGNVGGASSKLRGVASLVGGAGGGEIAGLVGDIGDAVEALGALKGTAVQLVPSLVATAAGMGLMLIPLLAVVAALGALAVAAALASEESRKAAEDFNREVEARRKVNAQVQEGLTSDQAREQLEKLKKAREDEAKIMQDNQNLYQQSANHQGLLAAGWKIVNHEEAALTDQIDKSGTSIKGMDAEIAELEKRLTDGSLAANDAAKSEEELAATRTSATLSAAAAAGQAVAAQRAADEASYEANQQRLDSIGNETAAIQAQLAKLQESGDTSEAVANQIASLTAQLSALGGESDYITGTALAASKARDDAKQAADDAEKAQEKAARDAEQAQEKAQNDAEAAQQKQLDAARNFGDKMVSIAQDAADKAGELVEGLKQTLTDNRMDFLNDIHDMSQEFNASELEEEIARRTDEATDLRQHALSLTKIRDDAFKNETDLERQRDFLGATRVREAANDQQTAEVDQFQRAQDEKLRMQEAEDAKQLRELDRARRERLQLLERSNAEAKQAYARDVEAQKAARRIAERNAAADRDKAIRDATTTARAYLGIEQQKGQTQIQIAQETLNSLRGMQNVTNNNDNRRGNFGSLSIPISGAGIPPDMIANTVIDTLGTLGMI